VIDNYNLDVKQLYTGSNQIYIKINKSKSTFSQKQSVKHNRKKRGNEILIEDRIYIGIRSKHAGSVEMVIFLKIRETGPVKIVFRSIFAHFSSQDLHFPEGIKTDREVESAITIGATNIESPTMY